MSNFNFVCHVDGMLYKLHQIFSSIHTLKFSMTNKKCNNNKDIILKIKKNQSTAIGKTVNKKSLTYSTLILGSLKVSYMHIYTYGQCMSKLHFNI